MSADHPRPPRALLAHLETFTDDLEIDTGAWTEFLGRRVREAEDVTLDDLGALAGALAAADPREYASRPARGPDAHPPGSEGRLRALAARVRRRERTDHPGDARPGDEGGGGACRAA